VTDLVIFDCDGVVADSEIISAQVLIRDLAKLDIHIDTDYVRHHFLGRSFPTVAKTIREAYDRPLPADFEKQYRAGLLERFESDLRATPGLERALDFLAGAGLPVCVATSSSPPRVARTLALLGLTDRFGDHVFTASLVPNGKPAPDLFLYAAGQMGARPERSVVIEDSLPGLFAGRAAGMHVLCYCGGEHLGGQAPDAPFVVPTFDNWADFPEVLGAIETKDRQTQ